MGAGADLWLTTLVCCSPDFRSPETGLYANLQKYDLPSPEDIFDIEYLVVRPSFPASPC